MTIINPIPVMIPGFQPITPVTPFTYRDGLTYLEVLEDFREYIKNVLVPWIDTSLDIEQDSITGILNDLIEQFNAAVTAMLNGSVVFSDPVITAIVEDITSDFRVALDSIYASKASVIAIQGDVTAIQGDVTAIQGDVTSLETLTTTGRLSDTELTAKQAQNIAEPGPVMDVLNATFALSGGAEGFVAKDDMRASGLVVAAAGDSTSDETQEFLWRGIGQWLATRPDITAKGYYGYGESGPYVGPVDMQIASGGEWINYYSDLFDRTGEVLGSIPDKGNAYGGGAGWIMDGEKASLTVAGSSVTQDADYTAPGGRRRVVVDFSINTTPGASSSKVISLYLGQNLSNRVQVRLSVSTAGVWALELIKNVAGVATSLGTVTPTLAANSVVRTTLSIEYGTDGTVTGKVGATTVSGTLTAPDIAAIVDLGARIYIVPSGNDTVGSLSLYGATADKFVVSARTLTFYNGSRAGSVAQYAIDRMASLYPVPVDVLFINYGHNNGSASPSAFLATINALCTAFKAAHPESGIVLVSQNPEYAGANIAAHRARNAALRRYATVKGYGYLPLFELYASQTDGGASWVQGDGIHPKTNTHTADPNNGSYQGAVLLKDYLNQRSLRV